MAMTAWEYKTFRLGEEPHPYKKYKLLQQDQQSAEFKADPLFQDAVMKVRNEFLEEYADQIVAWNEGGTELEADAWVHKLARQSAVELLAEGKVTSQTMLLMTLLGEDKFKECVRMGGELANELNSTVQGVEEDLRTVPDHFMG